MDVVDRAERVSEAFLEGALARVRRDAAELRHGVLLGPLTCLGCGTAIPDGRRAAMPRAERCVDCQAVREGAVSNVDAPGAR